MITRSQPFLHVGMLILASRVKEVTSRLALG